MLGCKGKRGGEEQEGKGVQVKVGMIGRGGEEREGEEEMCRGKEGNGGKR